MHFKDFLLLAIVIIGIVTAVSIITGLIVVVFYFAVYMLPFLIIGAIIWLIFRKLLF